MINFYAYTYPNEVRLIKENKGLWVKLGDTIRSPDVRMAEQGGASEREDKIIVGTWENVSTISRDYQLHAVLKKRGCRNRVEASGRGTEWFKIDVANEQEAFKYISNLIDTVGGANTSLKTISLRSLQKRELNKAMDIAKLGANEVNIVANLCPRFGKTIWALSLFNEISKTYNSRIMLLPAYWLSVHSSFEDEIQEFREFADIDYISGKDNDAEEKLKVAFAEGRRVVLDLSLHGELEQWKKTYEWIKNTPNEEFFIFSDEADFGTHTDNQRDKMKYLFEQEELTSKFISVYASGTNIQRIAKNATGKLIDGVLNVAYSELEQTETNIIPRSFYSLRFEDLYDELEAEFKPEHVPSWSKIWSKPNKCKNFIEQLFKGITASDDMLAGINLSAAAEEDISGIMCFMSINKTQMNQAAKIIQAAIPDWKVKVLNGDETSNKRAQQETKNEIKWAKEEGKKGIVILSNSMGSRSYSVSEIQAAVVMYDNGSIDATTQKISRPLTPGVKWDGDKKEHGHIFTFSFDPNRNENIENLVIYEAVQVQQTQGIEFEEAIKFVFKSVNIFSIDRDGDRIRIDADKMFADLSESDTLLRIADIAVRIDNLTPEAFEILGKVVGLDTAKKKKLETLAPKALSKDKKEKTPSEKNEEEKAKKSIEKMLNEAIRAINRSATTVYNISGAGNNYRECLRILSDRDELALEYQNFYGISVAEATTLIDMNILNTPILDVVVQNSQTDQAWF